MNLRGVVAVSGKSGLFKLVGQNKAGYILESLDAQKLKVIANMTNSKLAALEEITVYGETEEIKLVDVFSKIDANKANLPDVKADPKELRKFFVEVLPDHDQERVYASDMKKIISWYLILSELPLFTEPAPEALQAENAAKLEEKAESKAKAPKTKPSSTKAPSAKSSAPAKKATMNSKRGG